MLLLAGHLLETRLDQALQSCGMTTRQYRALRQIADHPEVTRVALADALSISRQAGGGLSQRMWRGG
jgi:DNA-binding MarR family transcriptional regulator